MAPHRNPASHIPSLHRNLPPLQPSHPPRRRQRHQAGSLRPRAAAVGDRKRRALRLHAPHPPRPRLPQHLPPEAPHRRDLQPEQNVGDHGADQDGAAHARPEKRRRDDAEAAAGGGLGGLPGRDDMQGALPAEVQLPVRGARRRDRAGGGEDGGEHVLRDDGEWAQVFGSDLLSDEPEAGLRCSDS